MGGPSALARVLADEAARRDAAWSSWRAELGLDGDDAELAELVLDDPSRHPWRLVDAALARSSCPTCSGELGAGPRGCRPCDLADGNRFGAIEQDRPAVPPGNEHAIRVALTVARFPHRWPAANVAGARRYLPLFVGGDMPTRQERYVLLEALRAGRADEVLAGASSFAEATERARRLDGR